MQQNKSTIPVGNRPHHFLIRALSGVATLAVLTTACARAITSISTVAQPIIQAITETPFVTNTSLSPTATLMPATATPTMLVPTVTPTPLRIAALNPYLIGVGEHGAMICLKPDQTQQLKGLVFTASISQSGTVIDSNISAENISPNRICFEMIDARYKLGVSVKVEVNAKASSFTLDNAKQTVDLGNYGVINSKGKLDNYPFLTYIYPPELGLKIVELFSYGNVNKGFHPAIDFTPFVNSTYPSLKDVPVLSPITGYVFQVGMDDPDISWI